MAEAPVEFIVAAFQDEHGAENALKELKHAKREHLIRIDAAAVVRRDKKDKLHVKEMRELTGPKGALGGLVIGAAVGLLTGGTGLILGAIGAGAGAFAGKKHDIGFSNARLQAIGDSLQPGTSAVLAVIEHKWVEDLQNEFEELGADVMTAALAADISEQLAEGREVGYSVLADEGGVDMERVAGDEHSAEYQELAITEGAILAREVYADETGVAAKQEIVTEEGVAVEGFAATEDDMVYAAAAFTDEGAVMITAEAHADEAEAAGELTDEGGDDEGDESA